MYIGYKAYTRVYLNPQVSIGAILLTTSDFLRIWTQTELS